MNVFKSQKKKVSGKHRKDCPGIFNWHSKHNTKYSVLWKHKRGLPNGTQMKKCKNTPFGRPYKGKEVLLWKAGKVMVRLSIVKIEVWPFKTLFIYSYTLSLIPLGRFFFLLYRQVNVGRRWPRRPVEAARGRWRRRGFSHPQRWGCWAVTWFRRCVWYFQILSDRQWRARRTPPSWAQQGFPSEAQMDHLIYTIGLTGGGGCLGVCLYSARTVHEMLQVSILKWLHPTCCWCLSHSKKRRNATTQISSFKRREILNRVKCETTLSCMWKCKKQKLNFLHCPYFTSALKNPVKTSDHI